MEHIVQFAVGIDDAAIKQRVEEKAYDDILAKLYDECKLAIGKRRAYSADAYIDWISMAEDTVEDFLSEHKDEIIDQAAEKLKNSMCRTKAYKEKMKEIINEK